MEFPIFRAFFPEKKIVNPLNTNEIFTCQDLQHDFTVCRKEKRMKTGKIGRKSNCNEFRALGKFLSIFVCVTVLTKLLF